MYPDADLHPRQIWANPTPTTTALPRHCTPFKLPSGGYIDIGNGTVIQLAQEAVFQPECTDMPGLNSTRLANDSSVFQDEDPFYASTSPQMYALAAVTIVSYILVFILFITPRTFFVSGSSGGGGFLGQRGMISGASGSTSVIGVGSRPWLQKVAALTVAISMTIASVDTFNAARQQYDDGYSDATALSNEVIEGLEIRIVRVISETCLWLAQAQTLIRLFPRHKEKVVIKWAGFVLIGLDTIFSILNKFVSGTHRSAPRKFQDAVPALSYLFTFCLSLIYAAWIIYYSLSKRRYAFLHPKMRNICLVALLSYVAVLIPVVFFILDISIYNVAGWGNYVRWVGAAAASVVVWEWVERIETLEREEKKDGILGREIFDGDEMLEVTPPSAAVTWSNSNRPDESGHNGNENAKSDWGKIAKMANKLVHTHHRPRPHPRSKSSSSTTQSGDLSMNGAMERSGQAAGNPATSTGVPTGFARAPVPNAGHRPQATDSSTANNPTPSAQQGSETGSSQAVSDSKHEEQPTKPVVPSSKSSIIWNTLQRLPIPFLSRHMSPPLEVKQAVRAGQAGAPHPNTQALPQNAHNNHANIFDKIGLRRPPPTQRAPLPVTIIPAPAPDHTSWDEVRFNSSTLPYSRNQPAPAPFGYNPQSMASMRVSSRLGQRYSPAPLSGSRLSKRDSTIVTEHDTVQEMSDFSAEYDAFGSASSAQAGPSSLIEGSSLSTQGLGNHVKSESSPLPEVTAEVPAAVPLPASGRSTPVDGTTVDSHKDSG
ncbi:MAG: hypothetical protein LQ351_003331 [Letrouitia transgressa]|nr:MAG: hypothetical protein LQ351_003331 [Letrouitia transgressa]